MGAQNRTAAWLLNHLRPVPVRPAVGENPDPSRESDSCGGGTSCRVPRAVQVPLRFATSRLRCVLALFRSRREQAIAELALRQQLAAYTQAKTRPKLTSLGRASSAALHPKVAPRRSRTPLAASSVGLPSVGGLHHRHV